MSGYLCHGGEHCVHGSDSTHWVDVVPENLVALGADDPEMQAIERLFRDAGLAVAYAVDAAGKRVHPGNAYQASGLRWAHDPEASRGLAWQAVTHVVECGPATSETLRSDVIRIDHHRPGDPGHAVPPERFLEGSSIGQVVVALANLGKLPWPAMPTIAGNGGQVEIARHAFVAGCGWAVRCGAGMFAIPSDIVIAAAADHCLEAAYRGRCPGVDPDALMRWRAESRAAFQKRSVEAVLADIRNARSRLRERFEQAEAYPGSNSYCPHCDTSEHRDCMVSAQYADLRWDGHIPELPEAACREGIPFLSTVRDRDGREKVVLQAAPADLVRRFLAGEIVPGLCDMYGSPERGLAGGYTTKKE